MNVDMRQTLCQAGRMWFKGGRGRSYLLFLLPGNGFLDLRVLGGHAYIYCGFEGKGMIVVVGESTEQGYFRGSDDVRIRIFQILALQVFSPASINILLILPFYILDISSIAMHGPFLDTPLAFQKRLQSRR